LWPGAVTDNVSSAVCTSGRGGLSCCCAAPLSIRGHNCGVVAKKVAEQCPGCGVALPAADQPPHPYMTCSTGCWARYGELLAVQYSDPQRMTFHQLVVDAYAAQHPDGAEPRAVQSVAIHLMTLYLFVERDVDPALGPRLHRGMVARPVFHQLTPAPQGGGRLTLLDVPLQGQPDAARAAVYAWANEVWKAWARHHHVVRAWVREAGIDDPS